MQDVFRKLVLWALIGVFFLSGPALAQENYCKDPESWTQWDQLLAKYPEDVELQALRALKLGICLKIERGDRCEGLADGI